MFKSAPTFEYVSSANLARRRPLQEQMIPIEGMDMA
jgi:hypothetical protein